MDRETFSLDTNPPLDCVPHSRRLVGICGPLIIERNGVEFRALPHGQRVLLGLLALWGDKTVTLDSSIGTLWPTAPPATAVAVVRTYISRLRAFLHDPGDREPCISHDGGGYQLRLGADEVDFLAFRKIVNQARTAPEDVQACALFERAMRLWRGDPLENVGGLHGHPAVTAAANERVLAALEYAKRAAALGRHDMVLGDLMALAASNPLDEPLHAALMIALAGSGRQAESLRVYEGLRRRLDEELGMLPSDDVRAAHQRVLRQEVGPDRPKDSWSVPLQIPVSLTVIAPPCVSVAAAETPAGVQVIFSLTFPWTQPGLRPG